MKISRSIFIIIVLACVSVTIVSQELRKVVTDVVKAGSQFWVKGTDVTTFFDNLSGNKTTSLSYGANSIDEDAINDNAIQNRHIEDMTIGWPETSLSLRDSIRNAKPTTDNETIIKIAGDLAVSDTFNVAVDTTMLKTISGSPGKQIWLEKISATNNTGSGYFIYKDTVITRYASIPQNNIFDSNIGRGYLWLPASGGGYWFNEELLKSATINLMDAGIKLNDATAAAYNRDLIDDVQRLKNILGGSLNIVFPYGVTWVNKKSDQNYCIEYYGGVVYRGDGQSGTTGAGSVIKLNDSQNCYVFGTQLTEDLNSWLHWSRLSNLVIDCNGDNNTFASAGDFYQMGENAEIKSIMVQQYKGHGLRFSGAHAPLWVENVTLFPATSAGQQERTGVFVDSSSSKMSFKSLSGDYNSPFFKFHRAAGNVDISGVKIENTLIDTTSKKSLFYFDDVDGNTITVEIAHVFANTADMQNYVYVNYSGSAIKPFIRLKNSFLTNSGSAYNIYRTPIDSAYNVTGNYFISDLPFSGNVTVNDYRYGSSIFWSTLASGVGFIDHLGNYVLSIFYNSDQKLHIKSPRNSILFEDYNGNDLLEVGATSINAKKTFVSETQFNMESPFLLKQQTTPGNPPTDYVYTWLNKNGSDYFFLVKFPNGDVDTLATSLAP